MFNLRGNDYSPYGWEAHHKTAVSAGGADTLSNCEILCILATKRPLLTVDTDLRSKNL